MVKKEAKPRNKLKKQKTKTKEEGIKKNYKSNPRRSSQTLWYTPNDHLLIDMILPHENMDSS